MNTAEMYTAVRFHVNRTRSARFHRNRHLDVAINLAIEDIINDRVDSIKRQRSYNFESVMRVKNELSSIVKIDEPIALIGNRMPRPSDWGYTLWVKAQINGKMKDCEPMDINERHGRNNLVRPSVKVPKWIEAEDIEIMYGGGANNVLGATGYFSYIIKPRLVSSGSDLNNTATLVIGEQYLVLSGTVTHDLSNYTTDQVFTATSTTYTGTGIICQLVNTNLGSHLHSEICRRAAVILSNNVENQAKSTGKTIENEQS